MWKWLRDRYNQRFDEWYRNFVDQQLAEAKGEKTPSPAPKTRSLPKMDFGQKLSWVWQVGVSALWPAILLVVCLVGLLSQVRNGYDYLFSPSQPYASPTALPAVYVVPTDVVKKPMWSDIEWMSPSEALLLRNQPDVVNFAFLDERSVKYAKHISLKFASQAPWKKVNNPAHFQAVSVLRTSATFVYNGFTYVLNVGQPFTSKIFPRTISVIDMEGNVWQVNDDTVPIDELSQVQKSTLYRVQPNNELSITQP